mmetsp:Transcript_32897/g.74400  ORF Transcript_32897/g.74400 Transcript_32897/m.74400 type:complete len:205 (+) Transcript_32897:1414-2028(+)
MLSSPYTRPWRSYRVPVTRFPDPPHQDVWDLWRDLVRVSLHERAPLTQKRLLLGGRGDVQIGECAPLRSLPREVVGILLRGRVHGPARLRLLYHALPAVLLRKSDGVLGRQELHGHVCVAHWVACGAPAHKGIGPSLGLAVIPLHLPDQCVLSPVLHALRRLEDLHRSAGKLAGGGARECARLGVVGQGVADSVSCTERPRLAK